MVHIPDQHSIVFAHDFLLIHNLYFKNGTVTGLEPCQGLVLSFFLSVNRQWGISIHYILTKKGDNEEL